MKSGIVIKNNLRAFIEETINGGTAIIHKYTGGQAEYYKSELNFKTFDDAKEWALAQLDNKK